MYMSTFSKVMISGVIASFILFVGFNIGNNLKPVHEAVAGSFMPVEGTQFTLSMTALPADTTITLSSFQTPDGRNLTMSSFGGKGYGTLDPTNTSRIESVSFTGITQNANGSATLTGVSRGVDFIFPYGATASLGKTHLVGSQFILSNTSAFYGNEFLLANQTGTSTAILIYSSTTPPRYDLDPGAAYFTTAPASVFPSLGQLNRTAIAGASNASRFTQGLVQVAFRGDAASSTALGNTGAFGVLTTDIATSSPSISMSTSSVVMTRLDSRIDPIFMSTSSTYTFGGVVANTGGFFSVASSTILATTTLSANVALGKGLVLNGVSYTAPSSQGSANSVLVNDGTGKQSWGSVPQLSTVGVTGISLSTTGWATSTTQLTLPAGALNASSTIEVIGGGSGGASAANAAMNCTLYIRDSTGRTLNSFTVTSTGAAGNSAGYTYHAFISATSTTASQNTYISGIGVDSGVSAGSGVTTLIDTLGNSGINFASALTLTVAVQDSTVNGSCSNPNVQYIVKP